MEGGPGGGFIEEVKKFWKRSVWVGSSYALGSLPGCNQKGKTRGKPTEQVKEQGVRGVPNCVARRVYLKSGPEGNTRNAVAGGKSRTIR